MTYLATSHRTNYCQSAGISVDFKTDILKNKFVAVGPVDSRHMCEPDKWKVFTL